MNHSMFDCSTCMCERVSVSAQQATKYTHEKLQCNGLDIPVTNNFAVGIDNEFLYVICQSVDVGMKSKRKYET